MKKIKTIDIVKKWLKDNCAKGEVVEIGTSHRVLVISKIPRTETFTYKYVSKPKKKK